MQLLCCEYFNNSIYIQQNSLILRVQSFGLGVLQTTKTIVKYTYIQGALALTPKYLPSLHNI